MNLLAWCGESKDPAVLMHLVIFYLNGFGSVFSIMVGSNSLKRTQEVKLI